MATIIDVNKNAAEKLPLVVVFLRKLAGLSEDSFPSEAVTPDIWLRTRRALVLAAVTSGYKLTVRVEGETDYPGKRVIKKMKVVHVPSDVTVLIWPDTAECDANIRCMIRQDDYAKEFCALLGVEMPAK